MPLGRHTVYRGRYVKADFKLDVAGIAGVAVSSRVRDACRNIAERKAKPYAISISPIDTGEYIRSFKVLDQHTTIHGLRRVAARLYNTSPHAAIVEWGNARAPARHVLTETIDHLHGGINAFNVGGAID
jgi:hypothetical protein